MPEAKKRQRLCCIRDTTTGSYAVVAEDVFREHEQAAQAAGAKPTWVRHSEWVEHRSHLNLDHNGNPRELGIKEVLPGPDMRSH